MRAALTPAAGCGSRPAPRTGARHAAAKLLPALAPVHTVAAPGTCAQPRRGDPQIAAAKKKGGKGGGAGGGASSNGGGGGGKYKSPGDVREGSAYSQETRKIILSLEKIRKVRGCGDCVFTGRLACRQGRYGCARGAAALCDCGGALGWSLRSRRGAAE